MITRLKNWFLKYDFRQKSNVREELKQRKEMFSIKDISLALKRDNYVI